ncbi:MAG TPA: uroporphyrinogen-III synthase [Rhizomicrobium sp.]|nr:uroporphyrinogen-III synthase [Rhizomicrobium sp.]
MRILITRPREDGAAIAGLLVRMGHQPLPAPLLAARFLEDAELPLDGVQAILATSANGVRALVHRLGRREKGFDIPLFAVGPQTAAEAEKSGFTAVRSADGDARALAEAAARWAVPEKGALLHVCGEDAPGVLAQDLAARGFAVRRAVLYRMDAAAALPAEAEAALKSGALDAAMFFSPRSARVFCDLARDLPTDGLVALCISPATAAALDGKAFARITVAARPNQAAMLALVA